MASPAQIITNQENAQQSTGPRTAEGKQRSSLNAVRHGLTSQLVVLPGEDQGFYESFRTKLFAELSPQGAVEEMLAESICAAQWRLERARKSEANILALAHYEDLPPAIDEIPDPAHRNAMIEAHAAVKYERALRNINVQEARLQRLLFKTMEEFRNLQSSRRQAEHSRMTAAINARTYHQAHARKFNPANFGFVFTTSQIDTERERRHMQNNPMSPHGPIKPNTLADIRRQKERFM